MTSQLHLILKLHAGQSRGNTYSNQCDKDLNLAITFGTQSFDIQYPDAKTLMQYTYYYCLTPELDRPLYQRFHSST